MRNENSYGGSLFRIAKGVGFALAFSLLSAVVFACILRSAPIPDKAIYPVNQTLKAVSIVLGGLFFVRGERGWLQGMGIGLLFTALSYLAFSALGGDFSLSFLIFGELALAAVSGALSGIIAVNVRR